MADNITRFRPYVSYEIYYMFEKVREVSGVSLGKILISMLSESETFIKLMERYEDASDEELRGIYMGPQLEINSGYDKKKKDS